MNCPCDRCKVVEWIPTVQYVKLDGDSRYLCARCWGEVREWYYNADRVVAHRDRVVPAT